MNDRPAFPLAAAVVALLVVLGGAVVGTRPKDAGPAAPAAASVAPKGEETPPPDPDPLRVLYEHFEYAPPPADKPPAGYDIWHAAGTLNWVVRPPGKAAAKPEPTLPADGATEYEFLICGVPDPVDSKLAFAFDAAADAIGRAFQARRFVLQASWLPWKREDVGKGVAGDLHRRTPGVLLFRKIVRDGGDKPTLAVVCLVGETPISGAHKPALTAALRAYDRLRAAVRTAGGRLRPDGVAEPVRLIAPYYSGSVGSVKNALQAWAVGRAAPDLPARFRLVSGTATAVDVGRYFMPPPADPLAAAGGGAAVAVHPTYQFQATAVPADLLSNAVLDYLGGGPPAARVLPTGAQDRGELSAKRRRRLGVVAYLREANTGWGVRQQDTEDRGDRVIDLPFPSSVSQIQADLEKLAAAPGSAPALNLPPEFATPRLPVRDGTHRDALPLYDRDTTVALAAELLRNTLATIHRERVRYVGIAASDARDAVFLNRLLYKHCPGVRTFTTEPTLVLSLPAESHHMRGMVVASPYPLYPPNQQWTRHPQRVPFLSAGGQGLYNAVLAAAGADDQLIEYRPPAIGRAAAGDRPPIWVSVIGSGGLPVPVRLYREYDDGGYVYRAGLARAAAVGGVAAAVGPPAELSPAPPVGLFVLVLTVFGLSALTAGACVTDWWRRTILHDPRDGWGAPRTCARLLVWVGGLLVVAPLVPLLAAERFELERPVRLLGLPLSPWDAVHCLLVLSLLCAAVTGVALFWAGLRGRLAGGLKWSVKGMEPGHLAHRWTAPSFWLAAAGGGCLVAQTGRVWAEPAGDAKFLWLARAGDLGSGVSPLLPTVLLGAALAAAGVLRLKQARMLDAFRFDSPYPVGEPFAAVADRLRETDEECRGHAWRRLTDHPLNGPLLGGAGVFVLWYALAVHRTLEGALWDWTVFPAFGLAFVALALLLTRLLTVWHRLRRLARAIDQLPMAVAFERLPEEVGRLFHRCLFDGQPRGDHLRVAWREWQSAGGAVPDVAYDRDQLGYVASAEELAARCRDRLSLAAVELWPGRSMAEAYGRPDKPAARPDGETRSAAVAGEDFAATVIALHLTQYFVQLRLTATALAVAAPLALLAAASYPFEPERPLIAGFVTLAGLAAAAVGYVLYDVNRNELVSRIVRSDPGRFTPDRGFLLDLLKYVGPLLLVGGLEAFGLLRVVLDPLLGAAR